MTVRHIVVARFADSASDEQIAALSAGLDTLPTAIAEVRSYVHGRDLALRAGNWDYGVVAQFDSVEDFHVYREHPDHQALVRDLLDPISEERASVQLDR
jgi:hypothetical protein